MVVIITLCEEMLAEWPALAVHVHGRDALDYVRDRGAHFTVSEEPMNYKNKKVALKGRRLWRRLVRTCLRVAFCVEDPLPCLYQGFHCVTQQKPRKRGRKELCGDSCGNFSKNTRTIVSDHITKTALDLGPFNSL